MKNLIVTVQCYDRAEITVKMYETRVVACCSSRLLNLCECTVQNYLCSSVSVHFPSLLAMLLCHINGEGQVAQAQV